MVSKPLYKTTNSTEHDNVTYITESAIMSHRIGMVHSMGTFHVVPVLDTVHATSNNTHKGWYIFYIEF